MPDDAPPILPAADLDPAAFWFHGPPTSHVARWRYLDPRLPGTTIADGRGRLEVVFRPTKTKGESGYVYYFADPAEGSDVFTELSAAEHPGEVVHQRLRLAGVPFGKL